jgi:two-component system nitrogen regulation sensor histidine kinase NtrY
MAPTPTSAADMRLSDQENRRRRRELILIGVIILVVVLLTFLETRVIQFDANIPVSNTILLFILININLLLLILLIFLVFRNLVKLLYDRRRKVMGSRLRTRLVAAFMALTLLPTGVLFFFSLNFITSSIEFWFNVPVEQSFENSLWVGRQLYQREERIHQFYLERMAAQLDRENSLTATERDALKRYADRVRSEYHFHAVEVYAANTDRLVSSIDASLEDEYLTKVATDKLLKDLPFPGVRSISRTISDGELIQTIAAVPYGAKSDRAKGFVVVSGLLPTALSMSLQSISRGYEEYQQIILYKKPIQLTYYIFLSIVALLVLFCAVWFGFYLAKTISIPIKELAEGTRRVAEGELDFSISAVADDEIGSLVKSFNRMTRDLRVSREQLEQSAWMQLQQNQEIEEKRRYMETVLRSVSAGVVTLDASGKVATINKSAERMLSLSAENVIGNNLNSLVKIAHRDFAGDVMESLSLAQDSSAEIPLRLTISGRPRSFLVTVNALKDDRGRHLGIVMVFDDLTELEKGQRMAAWREVARRIAHEVKNPLTPITLSAQRLKRRFAHQVRDPVFEECTQMIIGHVDLIRSLVNEFSSFARFPSANLKPEHLPPIVAETVALYREGHPNVVFDIEIDSRIPEVNLDRQQMKQALINLIDNALAAIKGAGEISVSVSHDPVLNRVRIEVADDGSGISDSDKTRLFEPNFSTKKSGMGLGLTIVNTIVADHNGTISVRDNLPHGARFVIELPA